MKKQMNPRIKKKYYLAFSYILFCFRWCEATKKAMNQEGGNKPVPGRFVEVLYAGRFRRTEDKQNVLELYRHIFEPDYPLRETTGYVRYDTKSL